MLPVNLREEANGRAEECQAEGQEAPAAKAVSGVLSPAVVVGFPEIEIESTVTVLLWKFDHGKIPLPLEVELCPIGLEKDGWRAAAVRVLREAAEARQKRETLVIS